MKKIKKEIIEVKPRKDKRGGGIYLEESEIKVQKERGIKLQLTRTCKFTWKLYTGCFPLYEDYPVGIILGQN